MSRGIDKKRAEDIMVEFLKRLKAERPNNFKESFSGKYCEYRESNRGSHVFVFQKQFERLNTEAIVVRQDEKAFEVYGACADVYLKTQENIPRFGDPLTGERWIGSGIGRYQLFDSGIVRWENTNSENCAVPYFYGRNPSQGYSIECMVAFIDIRGFTKWSQKHGYDKMHEVISSLESVLQRHFALSEFKELFLKGTGDGFMIAQEGIPYAHHDDSEKVHVAVDYFIGACMGCCKSMATILKEYELTVGFGVDIGELKKVLILGRWDYIGDAVNNASKLQSKGENEVIISEACYEKLNDKSSIKGRVKPHSYILKPR